MTYVLGKFLLIVLVLFSSEFNGIGAFATITKNKVSLVPETGSPLAAQKRMQRCPGWDQRQCSRKSQRP
eukprot:4764062-Amphidinium_carterae.1